MSAKKYDPPKWLVYVGERNGEHRIVWHNVFDHHGFLSDVAKKLKGYDKTYKAEGWIDVDAISADLRSEVMYYYRWKCEWEIVLSHWPPNDGYPERKIDVYDQLELNWDAFVGYCWTHRKEIIKWAKERTK